MMWTRCARTVFVLWWCSVARNCVEVGVWERCFAVLCPSPTLCLVFCLLVVAIVCVVYALAVWRTVTRYVTAQGSSRRGISRVRVTWVSHECERSAAPLVRTLG